MKLLERRQKMRGMRGAMKMARRDAYRNSGKNNQVSYSGGANTDTSGCSIIFFIGIILFFVIVISSCS